MPTRQTTLLSHFPSSPQQPSSSKKTDRPIQRPFALPSASPDPSDVDSEGSEGLNRIRLSHSKHSAPMESLPMTQKRARRQVVLDSEDEIEGDVDDLAASHEESGGPSDERESIAKGKGRAKGQRRARTESPDSSIIDLRADVEEEADPEPGPEKDQTPPRKSLRRNTASASTSQLGPSPKKRKGSSVVDLSQVDDAPTKPKPGRPSKKVTATVETKRPAKARGAVTSSSRAKHVPTAVLSPIPDSPIRLTRGRLARKAVAQVGGIKKVDRKARLKLEVEIVSLPRAARDTYLHCKPGLGGSIDPVKRVGTGAIGRDEEVLSARATAKGKGKEREIENEDEYESENENENENQNKDRSRTGDDRGNNNEARTSNDNERQADDNNGHDNDSPEEHRIEVEPIESDENTRSKGKDKATGTRKEKAQALMALSQKMKSKRTGRAGSADSSASNSDPGSETIARRRRTGNPRKSKPPPKHRLRKPSVEDPDEGGAVTEEESDAVHDLELDEPERFKKTTRLRKRKETAFQRNLRKLKEKKAGIVADTTEEDSEANTVKSYTSDSAADSLASEPGSEDFIEDDGGHVQDGLLPHEFSRGAAQTPEFKFKVVFQYLLLLVIKGPKILPLKGEDAEYLVPYLRDQQRKMEGIRNGSVRGQIWRPELVRALETFPRLEMEELEEVEDGCDICHMKRSSRLRAHLGGRTYDPKTHELYDSDSESDTSVDKLPQNLLMGRFCAARVKTFHRLSHWEHVLYNQIRKYYRELLRAKYKPVPEDSLASSSDTDPDSDVDEVKLRREDRKKDRLLMKTRLEVVRRRGRLPEEYRDVNKVTEWMEDMGYQNKEYRWIEGLIGQSQEIERDHRRDD
ncbi:hypothetical protein P7C73_g1224, partial [Tremellales sp. Uapishka_1]